MDLPQVYLKETKFINIPTTLLSQVDSSIGGKTGFNTKFEKIYQHLSTFHCCF